MSSSSKPIGLLARMGRKVVFRPAAERDLAALYAYIRDDRGDP